MQYYDEFFKQLYVDKSLTTDFFIIFARFEYALKRAGLTTGDTNRVFPNWDRFASLLKDDFNRYKTIEIANAVSYLDKHPPKKQVLDGKNLAWQDNMRGYNEPLIVWLLRLIRTVRNNLFHGGKFAHEEIKDPSRNEELLISSLVILQECIELSEKLCPDIKRYFYDYMA